MISGLKTLSDFIVLARGQAEDVTAEVVMEGDCTVAEEALSELIEAIYASRVLVSAMDRATGTVGFLEDRRRARQALGLAPLATLRKAAALQGLSDTEREELRRLADRLEGTAP